MADLYTECDWDGQTLILTLPEDPDVILVQLFAGRFAPRRAYVPERRALRTRVTVDERRTIGHDECGACAATVGMADRFCRMCGARLEGES